MRGAGASFGIVTEFVIETYPEPESTLGYGYTFTCGDLLCLSRDCNVGSPDNYHTDRRTPVKSRRY
jgi:hypothetical protein